MKSAMPYVCDVPLCPAVVDAPDTLCPVHETARRAHHVMTGTRCSACGRLLARGDWITRESTLDVMTHAQCPPTRPRRVATKLELLDALDVEP